MAPSRRQSNGRSPLVNQQRQITSFFSKPTTPSPSPSPSPSPLLSKQKPNPNATSDPNRSLSSSPSPSPTTPSPRNPKPNKPLLLIGASSPSSPGSLTPPSSAPANKQSYGQEVVGKRIKVYWPLDKAWYEGRVKSFDKVNSKHLVQYDDADEEMLDLTMEKIEWVQENVSNFKRLRRGSSSFKRVVVEEEGEVEEEKSGGDGDNDDSSDEDWGKDEAVEDADEEMEFEDEGEDEDEDDGAENPKANQGGRVESRKRAMSGGKKSRPAKKSKGENVSKGNSKVSLVEPTNNSESK